MTTPAYHWAWIIYPGLTLEIDDESLDIVLRSDRSEEYRIRDISLLRDALQLARNEQIHRQNDRAAAAQIQRSLDAARLA